MTLTLELPAELEKELAAAAQQVGMSLADYSLHLLATYSSPSTELKNGAELVAYWRKLGLIGSRMDIQDSQEHARQIRAKAEHRRTDS